MTDLKGFAACPRGLEKVVADEIRREGISQVQVARSGVTFQGTIEQVYRVIMWSRCASRVVVFLREVRAQDFDELYAAALEFPWEDHFAPGSTFAVRLTLGHRSAENTHFGALRVKDAIVDRARKRTGSRPAVDTVSPDLRVEVHLERGRAWLGIELAGKLHRRGYRRAGAPAPLRENLAAGVLQIAGWQTLASRGAPLWDPMCGSGTFLIEGALMALDVAPGLLSRGDRLGGWPHHEGRLWTRLVDEARARRAQARSRGVTIYGADFDPRMIALAKLQAEAAGLAGRIDFEVRGIEDQKSAPDDSPGLLVVNPPYGKRMGDPVEARELRGRLDAMLEQACSGWRVAMLWTTDQPPLSSLERPSATPLRNGKIECRLDVGRVPLGERPRRSLSKEEGDAFVNRVRKNLRRLRKWIEREDIHCYRLYDADLPQFALAVDRYEDWLHVQEYAPPATVDPDRAHDRLQHALEVLPELIGIPPSQVVCKFRQRQRGSRQYVELAHSDEFIRVREGGLQFWVNLRDRLDTGLFLDHRPTRAKIRDLARDRHVLNLFCYTGTATVYAAAGGAKTTTSVDLSRRYLDWGRRNLELNALQGEHEWIQEDVLGWIERPPTRRYGLVFLDPPTFSNSKRMQSSFDVQRDHGVLIRSVARLLENGGLLLFSTNRRQFTLDSAALEGLGMQDISRATTPLDFQLGPHHRPHHCFLLSKDD